jgi:ribose transport system permease protein
MQLLSRWGSRYGLLAIAVGLVVGFSIALPNTFPTSTTALAIVDSQAIIAMLALAEMVVVVVGEFDLSVGYNVGLCHLLAIGFIVRSGFAWPVSVALVLLVGALVGAANAFCITVAKIDSFIATLGIGTVVYAVSNWYTAQQQITGDLPTGFINIYASKLFGIPASVFYVAVVAIVLWLVLEFTAAGRYLYALGGNRRAAELSGIRPRRFIFGAYIAAGVIVAFTGIVLASRLQIGDVGNGPDFLLPTFVGAMLGSTTIKPGRANPFGTLVAVGALGIGIAGFQQLGGSTPFIVPLFNGATLVIGVGLAGYAARRVRHARAQPVTSLTAGEDAEETVQQ